MRRAIKHKLQSSKRILPKCVPVANCNCWGGDVHGSEFFTEFQTTQTSVYWTTSYRCENAQCRAPALFSKQFPYPPQHKQQ